MTNHHQTATRNKKKKKLVFSGSQFCQFCSIFVNQVVLDKSSSILFRGRQFAWAGTEDQCQTLVWNLEVQEIQMVFAMVQAQINSLRYQEICFLKKWIGLKVMGAYIRQLMDDLEKLKSQVHVFSDSGVLGGECRTTISSTPWYRRKTCGILFGLWQLTRSFEEVQNCERERSTSSVQRRDRCTTTEIGDRINNEEVFKQNATSVVFFANKLNQWSVPGPADEEKWCGSLINKPIKEVELHSDMWYGVEVSIDSLAKDGSKSCVVIGRSVDRYVHEFLTQCTWSSQKPVLVGTTVQAPGNSWQTWNGAFRLSKLHRKEKMKMQSYPKSCVAHSPIVDSVLTQ